MKSHLFDNHPLDTQQDHSFNTNWEEKMIRAKYVITLLTVAALAVYTNLASARQYTAKAGNFGTSITRTLAKASSGDVVFVEAGVYDGTYETFPLQFFLYPIYNKVKMF